MTATEGDPGRGRSARAATRRPPTVAPGTKVGPSTGSPGPSFWNAVLVVGLVSLAVLAFYVSLYPWRSFRVAIGSDTPVYIWWARRTGALGMRAMQAGGRPAIVGAMASLSDGLHLPMVAVATSIGPALAASVGLAMAAFADIALGADRLRFAFVALFTGALPITAPKKNCQVVRSMVSDLQRDLSCINATTMPGTNAGS